MRRKDAPQPQQEQARAPSTSAGTPIVARRMRRGAMFRQVYPQVLGTPRASLMAHKGLSATFQTQGEV